MVVDFDKVAFHIFSWPVHWYGIMYLVGFLAGWGLARYRAAKPGSGWNAQKVDDWLFYGGMGVILGGRIGYVIFYNFSAFIHEPLILLRIWEGGMSFHGGLLGVMFAMWLFARKYKDGYFQVMDFTAPMVAPALAAGRLGNFINAELWGKPTDLPWGMVFQGAGPLPVHPTPLYEALLEGVVLFILVWWFSSKPRPTMAVSGVFAIGYATFRILVEFVRLPDAHMGYLAFGWVTQGMLLSAPLGLFGMYLMWRAYRKT